MLTRAWPTAVIPVCVRKRYCLASMDPTSDLDDFQIAYRNLVQYFTNA